MFLPPIVGLLSIDMSSGTLGRPIPNEEEEAVYEEIASDRDRVHPGAPAQPVLADSSHMGVPCAPGTGLRPRLVHGLGWELLAYYARGGYS